MDSTTTLLAAAAPAVATRTAAVLGRPVRIRRDLRRSGLPAGPRRGVRGAALHFVLPTDPLPDPVYLDDIGVLLLAPRRLSGSDT